MKDGSESVTRIYKHEQGLDGFISSDEAAEASIDISDLKLASIEELQIYAKLDQGNCWASIIICKDGLYDYNFDTREYTMNKLYRALMAM